MHRTYLTKPVINQILYVLFRSFQILFLRKIESITTEINTFKNGINDSIINPNDLVDFIFKKEEEEMKTKFIAMKNKADRCEVRKFVVE